MTDRDLRSTVLAAITGGFFLAGLYLMGLDSAAQDAKRQQYIQEQISLGYCFQRELFTETKGERGYPPGDSDLEYACQHQPEQPEQPQRKGGAGATIILKGESAA